MAAEKFASANVCAVGIDFVVYDPNVQNEEGEPSGLQRFLSLTWEQVVELVEGHEATRTVEPELTDAALKLWGITGPPKVEGGVVAGQIGEEEEVDEPEEPSDATYLRELAHRVFHAPALHTDQGDAERLASIASKLEGIDGHR
jgi:hypothetical protein